MFSLVVGKNSLYNYPSTLGENPCCALLWKKKHMSEQREKPAQNWEVCPLRMADNRAENPQDPSL